MRYLGFTKEDEESFIALTERGLTAIFVYTNRVVCNGKRCLVNEKDQKDRVIAISGEMCLPEQTCIRGHPELFCRR